MFYFTNRITGEISGVDTSNMLPIIIGFIALLAIIGLVYFIVLQFRKFRSKRQLNAEVDDFEQQFNEAQATSDQYANAEEGVGETPQEIYDDGYSDGFKVGYREGYSAGFQEAAKSKLQQQTVGSLPAQNTPEPSKDELQEPNRAISSPNPSQPSTALKGLPPLPKLPQA